LSRFVLVLPLLAAAWAARAQATDFPPITDEERSLTAVPGEPNAPSVVLFKKGDFQMTGYGSQLGNQSSILSVQVRLKILTEEGKSNGEITIAHSDFTRLHGFRGRTVLPGGQVIPVSSEARFMRKTSRAQGTFVTAVAFPSVQVGAILDYQYELRFDSIYFLEPWYFAEGVPVRYSEIFFKAPSGLHVQAWSRAPSRVKIQSTKAETNALGWTIKAWAENVPSVPDDPYGPTYNDLAAQMLLLPSTWVLGVEKVSLLESWPKVCEEIVGYYDEVRGRDSGVAKKAQEIAGSGTPRQKSEALYRFVRDRIETLPFAGVIVANGGSLGEYLSKARGDRAEKALLLQAMLKAVKIDARLVWAGDRARGAIDPKLPNPNWFDTMFVMLEQDGKRVFLDPSDRSLGFGQLRYGYEGTPALIPDAKKPEGIVLPEIPFDQNLRRAEVELTLNEKGRLAGKGTLLLTGHRAWERTHWKDDEAKTIEAWKEWLTPRYREFQIADVKAVEQLDEHKVTVTWSMTQREEEALGDEATVAPASPLGPVAQPFVQAASARRTGVTFDYPSREEVQLRLHWPEGWKVESRPKEKTIVGKAGSVIAGVELKEGERTLVYTRRFDLPQRDFNTSQEYEAVRSLFGDLEKIDAQILLLVHR
jgi:transglutaminase-like putative cysteine protease